jgi:hypothetical protein
MGTGELDWRFLNVFEPLKSVAPYHGTYEPGVEYLRPALQRDVADDLGHGREVVAAVQRQDIVAVRHELVRAAEVLRWIDAAAGGTDGTGLSLPPV